MWCLIALLSEMAKLPTVIGATISIMWRTAGYAASMVGLMLLAAAAQNKNLAFAKFKGEMMSKVDQKITVVGTLHDGKQGFWLPFNNWGAYIYAAKESGLAKQDDLYAHFSSGQTVKVTGTLRHFVPPVGTGKDKYGRYIQTVSEHFFFDAAEVEISLVSPRTPKNPNK